MHCGRSNGSQCHQRSPTPDGRTLAEGGSRIIGIYLHTFRGKFYSSLIESLEQNIRQRGYIPLLTTPGYASSDNIDSIRIMLQYLVSGIVMTVRNALWHQESISLIHKANTPLVLLGRSVEPNTCCVYEDDYNGLKLAVKHLQELGHQHIGMASVSYDTPNLVTQTKEQGFIDALTGKKNATPSTSPINSLILRFHDGKELESLQECRQNRAGDGSTKKQESNSKDSILQLKTDGILASQASLNIFNI